MTFKANIGTDPRTIYTQLGGNDSEDGFSLETAKETIQGGVDAINALVPPPNGLNRASLIVSGAGSFSEAITFPNFTDVDASTTTNVVSTGGIYTLASAASYSFGLTNVGSSSSGTVFTINNTFLTSLQCSEADARGANSTVIEVSGTTDQVLIRMGELRCVGDSSIGVNYTATNGEAEVFLIATLNMEGDNSIGFVFDPSVSTARAVLDGATIVDVGSPTATTAIQVIDGHLSCFVNEIIATDAIDLQGGELAIISNCITGDITVAVGSTLICEITEFSGTLTNNGTIQGRIGDQYFTSGVVTTSDTLTNNTLVVGNGGVDVDNRENATLIDNGSTITLNLNSPSATGTSRFTVSDSSGNLKGELEYLETSDTVEMLFATSQFTIGAGPGASTLEFLGNDTELLYQTGGTDNAFTIDMTAGPDTNPPFVIDNGGTNGGVISFYVGGRDPEGNITADPGSIYYRQNGASSRTYQLEAASAGNTGWVANQGNVDGPGSSVDTALVTWDGTSGTLIQSFDNITTADDGANLEFRISAPMAGGNAGTVYRDDSFNERLRVQYDDNTTTAEINFQAATNEINSLNDLDITAGDALDLFATNEVRINSTASEISIQAETAVFLTATTGNMFFSMNGTDDTLFITNAGADTQAHQNWGNTGGNNGNIDIHVGNRDPNGNVTGAGGDLYVRDSGTTSQLYQNRTANTTAWTQFGDITGPGATVTDTALVVFDGTTGQLVGESSGVTSVTTASNARINFTSPSATGSVGYEFLDNTSTLQTSFLYNQSTDETLLVVDAGSGFEVLALNGPIQLRSTTSDIILDLSTSTTKVDIAGSSHTDSDALLTFASSDGSVDIHIGEDTPVGNVSATGGTLYFREDELDSSVFVKRSSGAASTTGWTDLNDTGGDVFGPGSSTNDSIPRFSGTSGTSLIDTPSARILTTANSTLVNLDAISSIGSTNILFNDETSTFQAAIGYNNSNDTLSFSASAGDVNGVALTNILMQMTDGAGSFTVDGTTTPDTVALFRLDAGGTNGSLTGIHCGVRNPEGVVNANPGDIYFQSDGADSDIYIHRAASAGTTGWVDLLATGVKTNLVSSVNESMVIWDGVNADTITQDSLILSVSSASAGALEILSPSASGFAGITFENSTSNTVFDIIFSETSGTTTIESGNGGDLDLVSAAQMNINSSDDIIISANSNDNSVTINADFVFNGTTNGAEFDIECPAADEFAFIQFQNASSAARMQIGYDQDVDQASIQTFQTSTDFLIRSHDQPVEIGVNTIADSPSVRISNTQYSFDIYSVLNDPQGSISATEGDIAVGANGFADSFIYFNKGSTSNTSWAIVDMQQKAFQFVGTTSTLPQDRNRILLNPNAGDITLSLPTAGTASRQNGFEQTLTKTITNTDIITIDTPGFYGHTGNFVMSKRGDSVTYLQDNSANVITYTNRRVIGIMERTGGAEQSIGGATGADIVLNGWNTNAETYEGLCEPDQANDRIVFPDVENLTDGDLYELELNLVCRWTNNSVINFHATVDDSGISTNYNIVMEQQSLGTADEMTLFGKTLIRTGTNDAVSLDTSVEIEFTLATGNTLFFKQGWLKLTKWEGR